VRHTLNTTGGATTASAGLGRAPAANQRGLFWPGGTLPVRPAHQGASHGLQPGLGEVEETQPSHILKRGQAPRVVSQPPPRSPPLPVAVDAARSSSLALLFRGPINQEIIQPSARFKMRTKPPGLLPSARPSLHRVFRISILWKNGRIRTVLRFDARHAGSSLNLTQPLFEPSFFRLQFLSKLKRYHFIEFPQFIYGHPFQVLASHVEYSDVPQND
jgi:hypothetical protein